MSPRRRPGKKLLKAFLPIVLVLVLALLLVMGWVVYRVTRPPRAAYLVTPENFSQLSARGLKATDENWANADGTQARGWLLRGSEGAPAVLLLHAYGSDRSHLFNLAVKLNETTNYTILLPDMRGHGTDPLVGWTSMGGREALDAVFATCDSDASVVGPRRRRTLEGASTTSHADIRWLPRSPAAEHT